MPKAKKVIDTRTLEVWESQEQAAKCLGVTASAVHHAIYLGYKVRGRQLEDFEFWEGLDPRDKENMAQSNFYFM